MSSSPEKRGPLGWPSFAPVALVLVLSAMGCGGCSPTYVLRAGYEEARILLSRQSIDGLLSEGDISPEERERLELILEARRFAEDELGMNVGGAYGSLAEVPPRALLYVVSGSEKLQLRPYTWWFPIVGDVTYKGFFERAEADAEVSRLREEGYDTYLRQSSAFSTLGWFDDPVLSTWLKAKPVALVRLILHELLHRTTYISGKTSFNESFATFAGNVGAIEFFSSTAGADSPDAKEAREQWRAEQERAIKWTAGLERLRALYRAGADGELGRSEVLAQRREIFAEFGPADKINNAVILARYAYQSHLDRFVCVFEEEGGQVRATLARIRDASESEPSRPFASLGSCAPLVE